MTKGTVKTQGTELFFLDPVGTSNLRLVKLYCPTGITGVGGGTKSQIPTTCLDTRGDEEFAAGLGQSSPISIPFNFIPSEGANQRQLFALKESGEVVTWMAGLSDGEDPPTLVGEGMVPPDGRTSIEFEAYVAEVNIDIATNEIVRGTLTLQRSGSETMHWLAPDVDVDA